MKTSHRMKIMTQITNIADLVESSLFSFDFNNAKIYKIAL